jgi:lactate dehydrogenase-like 2-hydroxyacid dehydrogenase
MTKKILVTGSSVRADLLQPLRDAGYEIDNPTHLLSEDELKEQLKDKVGYLLGGDEFVTENALSEAGNLKVISFLGMGYEGFIDMKAANKSRVPVTNTPGTLSNAVAECSVGLALSATRKLYKYATDYASGNSGNEQKQHDLAARHVGIVGLGGVGTRIAEIIRGGFGSKLSYHSRTRKIAEESRLGINYLSLGDLCKVVDVLFVMTPGNADTKGIIGEAEIASFKNGLILINTARPEVVDPYALLGAFETDKIDYAAFDNFYDDQEDVTSKLKAFIPSKLMVTAHIGSLTHEARDGMAIRATNSILNILKTGKDQYVVNGM